MTEKSSKKLIVILFLCISLFSVCIEARSLRTQGRFNQYKFWRTKCRGCDERMKKSDKLATNMNLFQCRHGKNFHANCVAKAGCDHCPICRQEFTLRKCFTCRKRISYSKAQKELAEEFTCCHSVNFHPECVDFSRYECKLCQKPFKTQPTECLECHEPLNEENPDAKDLKEFMCTHASHYHKKCMELREDCPTCSRRFRTAKEISNCIICLDPITAKNPHAPVRTGATCSHHLQIHRDCLPGSARKCYLCRAGL